MAKQRPIEASAAPEAELGEFVEEPKAEPAADEQQTVEAWRTAKKTPAWLFVAAKTLHRWPEGRVLDERAYDEAIHAAGSVRSGGHANYPLPGRRARRK